VSVVLFFVFRAWATPYRSSVEWQLRRLTHYDVHGQKTFADRPKRGWSEPQEVAKIHEF
jgi:hypothetical protein